MVAVDAAAINPELARRLGTVELTQRILWCAFTAAAFLFLGVILPFAGTNPMVPGMPAADVGRAIGYLQLGAAVSAVAALAWYLASLAPPARRRRFERIQAGDAVRLGLLDSSTLRADDSETLGADDQRILAFFLGQTRSLMVYLALADGVAVFGLVASILPRSPGAYLPFAAATVVLSLAAWPSYRATLRRLPGRP
jgi:hypothetical protein